MSLASKGKPKSEDHKEKLRQAKLKKSTTFWKGKKFSEEHKAKLRHAKIKKNGTNTRSA